MAPKKKGARPLYEREEQAEKRRKPRPLVQHDTDEQQQPRGSSYEAADAEPPLQPRRLGKCHHAYRMTRHEGDMSAAACLDN